MENVRENIKEEILERFYGLPEKHQEEVILWGIRSGIIKLNFKEKKIELIGEIDGQAFEQALKELKESGEIE